MENRTGSQEDLIFGIPGSSRWSDWRGWSGRRKIFVGASIFLSLSVLISVVAVIATYKSSSTVIPTPTPVTTTTMPTTTTTSTTTAKPTTTTTTTTTPPTTTTSSTTTKPTTTTTPPTTTTSSTTTKPTTTTTPPTTTTSSTTTKPTTTTIPTPTTHSPFDPSTKKPLPVNPTEISAINLLTEMGLDPVYRNITCLPNPAGLHSSFRFEVTIVVPHINKNYTWVGESDNTKHAKTLAARNATESLFGLTYPDPLPEPPKACKPVQEIV